jgi:hypothetical protein
VCRDEECQIDCVPGFGDCDTMIETGCETSLATTSDCGECMMECEDPEPLCAASGSGIAMCIGDCGVATECGSSCVNTDIDIMHCGGCDQPCDPVPNGAPECVDGECQARCPGAFKDCNNDNAPEIDADGCESDTSSNVDHCGECDRACPARNNSTSACVTGDCTFTCSTNFSNCDGVAANGCEEYLLLNPDHCGRCFNDCGTRDCCPNRQCAGLLACIL